VKSFSRYRVNGYEPPLKELSELLKKIYIEHSAEEIDFVWSQLLQILDEVNVIKDTTPNDSQSQLWDSSTSVLITYADAVSIPGEPSLKTLGKLLDDHIGNLSSVTHILPFLCSTSDGGFAVSSYERIEMKFGDWIDLKNISKNHILMADLVLNHVSSSHNWVQQFIQSKEPGVSYILSPSENSNWDNVIRPRNTSLFRTLSTTEGMKSVWTTFGPDQIDLNWKEPSIIIEFLNLIILYISNGIKWIRLDAVGFIWKESGTTCMHNDQVHLLVKALRIQLEQIISDGVIITETNVPEKENISYLTSANEAHLSYNFPLPPLLLESLFSGKADLINKWLFNWPELPENTSFINFTASHDGIGLRALEGLMDQDRFHDLLISCEKRGGLISHRRMPSGEDQPYELNISWWSAMADVGIDKSFLQFERFILSQLFAMSIKGIPAFYLQSLLASDNDLKTFGESGQRRDINRERFNAKTLFLNLEDPKSPASKNLKFLKSAMNIRSKLKCFDPGAEMNCLSKDRSDLVIISRGKSQERLLAIHNMTNSRLSFSFTDSLYTTSLSSSHWKDYLNNIEFFDNNIELKPYAVHWLKQVG